MKTASWLLLLPLLLAACQPGRPAAAPTPLPSASPSPAPSATPTRQPAATVTPTPIPFPAPQWFEQAVIYEIYVRSFADANGDGVGDLRGVTERLDYIQSLGADVIWLMPVYPSPSVHGYDVSDYLSVNPQYGTREDLIALVEAAHQRGMRVLLDFVPSHLSNQHPLFQEAYKNPASSHADWFVWTNDAHSAYAGFANNETMPRFNHYNPEVVAYLSEAARFWLDLDGDGDTTDGVDGFRVDNATFPPREFLVALRQAVKQANPQALMLGETWVHTPADMATFFPNQFDALFDFPFYALLQGDQNSNQDGLLAGKSHPALLTTLIADEQRSYPAGAYAVRFLNNHDTNRTASEVGAAQRQKLAAQFLAALPGPVMLYYGEEIGMIGQKGGPPHWDSYRREPMDWYANQSGDGQAFWFRPEDRLNQPGDGVSLEEQSADPTSTLNSYLQAFTLRRTLPAGEIVPLALQVSGAGVWGFLRSNGAESVVFVFNFSAEERQITVEAFPFDAPNLRDLLSGAAFPPVSSGETLTVAIPAASALWLASIP